MPATTKQAIIILASHISTKNLLVGDPEDYVSGRLLLEKYDTVLSKLNVKDIYKRHEEMYT